ncbi:MAG: dihydroorotate dehydrogenase [Firmicutes bacterium]|jgi:dihydroorotate dehydrogenase (NAD+) catalytic subunit|nr:dihydroorotate dehydrogenase [Bacillota bacterium]
MDTQVNLGGIKLVNPVVMASGTFGYGFEYEALIDLEKIGAIITKATTKEPWVGNRPPRIIETPCGMLNAIGLENPGVKVFLEEYLPALHRHRTIIIVNIAGKTIEEYAELASILETAKGIHGIELNISCPNVDAGGMHLGTDPDLVYEMVKLVKGNTNLPVIPKLSPNVADIAEIAKAAESAGADAVSMINTLQGMAIDIETKRPVLGNIFGGLSGPAIKPIALRMVYQVYKAVRIPILGGGGIISPKDAIEFLLAGASAVTVGTGTFVNPKLAIEIKSGIIDYMAQNGYKCLHEVIGAAVL